MRLGPAAATFVSLWITTPAWPAEPLPEHPEFRAGPYHVCEGDDPGCPYHIPSDWNGAYKNIACSARVRPLEKLADNWCGPGQGSIVPRKMGEPGGWCGYNSFEVVCH